MSSRACQFGCRPPYKDGFGRPCEACMRKHGEDMEDSLAECRMERAARAFDAILPATDREWEAHLDQVAPLVTPGFSLRFDLPSLN